MDEQGPARVGGVRVLLVGGERHDDAVSLDEPGTYVEAVAELLFRVGVVDERLSTSGATSLALRLADELAGPTEAQHRVSVGLTTSSLSVAGTRTDVAGHLQRFTAALSRLGGADVEPVRARLLAEEAGGARALPELPAALALFGARGPGLTAFPQLALPGLAATELQAWADRHLTDGAAVLHADGLDAGDLVLTLPGGPGLPEPALPLLPGVGGTHVSAGLGEDALARAVTSTSLALLVPRTWAAHAAVWTLRCHVERSLEGQASGVGWGVLPLDAATCLAAVQVESLPGTARACTDGLVAAVDQLLRRGPAAEQFSRDLRALLQRTGTLPADAVRRELALELLHGPVGDAGQPRQGLAEVLWTDVADVLVRLRETAVLTCPTPPTSPDWPPAPPAPRARDRLPGAVLASRQAASAGARLAVGPEGLSATSGPGEAWKGLPWDDVEVLLRGRRRDTLVTREGAVVPLDPASWLDAHGATLDVHLDAHVPPDRVRPVAEFREPADPPAGRRPPLPPGVRLVASFAVIGSAALLVFGTALLLSPARQPEDGYLGALVVLLGVLWLSTGVRAVRRARQAGLPVGLRSARLARLDAALGDASDARLRLATAAGVLLPSVALAGPVLLAAVVPAALVLVLLVFPAGTLLERVLVERRIRSAGGRSAG